MTKNLIVGIFCGYITLKFCSVMEALKHRQIYGEVELNNSESIMKHHLDKIKREDYKIDGENINDICCIDEDYYYGGMEHKVEEGKVVNERNFSERSNKKNPLSSCLLKGNDIINFIPCPGRYYFDLFGKPLFVPIHERSPFSLFTSLIASKVPDSTRYVSDGW